jgi:hypothetical protein
MLYVIGGIGVLFVAFIWWRYTSVERGARQRDARIVAGLEPLIRKLDKREEVSAEEIAALATKPQNRRMLYHLLEHHKRLDLFPEECLDVRSQAEAQLVYWMMHPNELQDPPEQIELVESVVRRLPGGSSRGEFLIFRYKMPEGHWAGKDGWLLGIAGPYAKETAPYTVASAFSRCGDKYGEVKPAELVDWYVGTTERMIHRPQKS